MSHIYERKSAATDDPFCGIGLGDRVRDAVTGFTGVVMARVEYLTGCNQVSVLPPIGDDGKYPGAEWFDIERMELLQVGSVRIEARPGGADIPPPPARRAG